MSLLDDPDYSRFAWQRYRRLMLCMGVVAAISTLLALTLLWAMSGHLPLHIALATGLGIFFAVLLAAALMGLVFLSSGSGHDGVIEDPFVDEWPDGEAAPRDDR